MSFPHGDLVGRGESLTSRAGTRAVDPLVPFDPVAYERAVAALFARRPEIMIPGLDRIIALAARLGDPQRRYPSIQITGTNGKTSMARMVTALLVSAGLRVGTYTSPHLQDVRERIRLDATPLSPRSLFAALQAVVGEADEVQAERGEMVTFFETLTAAAYLSFADAAVDVGVFEVGMGGRWDATNLVDGRVSIIGTVGIDHPELGATVEEVAYEKAGVIKSQATVVVGPQSPGAMAVIRREAAAREATLCLYGHDFEVASRNETDGRQRLSIRTSGAAYDVELPLAGRHQATNAACALAAAESYQDRPLSADQVATALSRVRSPGRLETFRRPDRATVVLDGAHNANGARALAEALAAAPDRRYVLVLGVLGDKDVAAITDVLVPLVDAVVVTSPDSVRAGPVDRLADAVRASGRVPHVAGDVAAALSRADGLAGVDDVIVVTGSLYTVGEARGLLRAPLD